MDTLMLVITAVSLAVAVGASAVAWRVTRRERQRSSARVAALAARAGVDGLRSQTTPDDAAAPIEATGDLREFVPAADAATSGGMFAVPVPDSGSGGRQFGLLVAAAVVAIVAGGGSLVMLVSGRGPAASTTPARMPLELVTLSHSRSEGQLVISGLVRNPATGGEVEQLEAQVRVFDAAGILVATRSAPVDLSVLAPSQDTSFVVAVGEAATAARYRVSFASRGHLLAHVDRRTNLPAAVTAEAR